MRSPSPLLSLLALPVSHSARAQDAGIDQLINDAMAPITAAVSDFIFYKVHLFGADIPLVVMWLAIGATFFTLYLGFINLSGFGHAVRVVRGDYSRDDHDGELSHFQALTAAVSGTVGIGNIGGVAVAISVGGPGAMFWMVLAGVLGMSTKFMECTLGTHFRRTADDGSISGGPMYYLERGLGELGFRRLGQFVGKFYALGIVIGCMGIGNMFQSNQAFVQMVAISGGEQHSWLADKGWLFGLFMALLVGVVIIGGIKSIARVTSKLVPFMALLYCSCALVIIGMNAEAIPFALGLVMEGAFTDSGMAGGAIGALIVGVQRGVFSNEAGIGTAAVAHSAVKTPEPISQGYVAMLEPFIDTVVICSMTALVVITTLYYEPGFIQGGIGGIEMTSSAFARNVSWSPFLIAVAAILFAFSTLITWSYYGLKGWTYLVGHSRAADLGFKTVFCLFVAVGCSVQLGAILDFSDAMVFVICVPNVLGLYLLAPFVKRELQSYRTRVASGEIPNYRNG